MTTDDSVIFDKIFNTEKWLLCKTFIMECIKENPNYRSSATKLLKNKLLINILIYYYYILVYMSGIRINMFIFSDWFSIIR